MEISNLPDIELKVMVIRMLNKLESRIEELREHFRKFKNVIKNQSEMKNKVTEMNNTLEGINSNTVNTKEQVSDLKDRIVEITQSQQQNEKTSFKK